MWGELKMRHSLKLAIIFFLVILTAQGVSALTLTVTGKCVDQTVTVRTDVPAFIIFRMNNGTPIFAEANSTHPAVFTPKITGKLNITAIAGNQSVTKIVPIGTCAPTTAPTLPYGTFKKTVDGTTYTIDWRTALGALEEASRLKGFFYSIEKTEWGPFVDCIKGICNGFAGPSSGWMYWVDYPEKPLPGVSADKYKIYPGDTVIWYFSRSMSEKPITSPYRIIIAIGNNYEIKGISIVWSSVVPPTASFTISPPKPTVGEKVVFDASSSTAPAGQIVEYKWDFGDGATATGKIVTHTYEKPGKYLVKLTVVANNGLKGTAIKTLEVLPKKTLVVPISFKTAFKVVNVTPGKKVEIKIPKKLNLPIVAINLTSSKPTAVKVEVSKAKPPARILYAKVYSCFRVELNKTLNAELTFKVPKNLTNVHLMEYKYGTWRDIPIKLIHIVDGFKYYRAKLKGFSVFVIVSKWVGFPLSVNNTHIQMALKYLHTLQKSDGGFANPGQSSSVAKTSWAIMAIAAAGQDPHTWKKNGKSPVDYLKEHLRSALQKMGTADYARTILAVIAAGENPYNFDGINLVKLLESKIKKDGQIGDYIYTTIWGILALKASGVNVTKSCKWLEDHQNTDGGFAWAVGQQSDFDDTAAAIQALIACGVPSNSQVIHDALKYLKEGQNPDGGMRYFGNSASNAASDSWTIQALVAAGINPLNWKKNNKSVVEHLLSLQTKEGYFKYTSYETSNPGYMTVCAIMALLGKPQPIKVLSKSKIPTTTTTITTTTTTTTVPTTTQKLITTVTRTTTTTTVSHKKKVPGFGLVLAIAAIVIAIKLRRR